jgi:hypothetical protein
LQGNQIALFFRNFSLVYHALSKRDIFTRHNHHSYPHLIPFPFSVPSIFETPPAYTLWMLNVKLGIFPQHTFTTVSSFLIIFSIFKEFVPSSYTTGPNPLILTTFHELFHKVLIHESLDLHRVSPCCITWST